MTKTYKVLRVRHADLEGALNETVDNKQYIWKLFFEPFNGYFTIVSYKNQVED